MLAVCMTATKCPWMVFALAGPSVATYDTILSRIWALMFGIREAEAMMLSVWVLLLNSENTITSTRWGMESCRRG
ncbi:uncharacterized protein L3040_005270 [Drepanopeziza brunnea f. sp. 'multigermtubi']|uniref:uncharacterized protein n=1 Tax=Drepanopeziza brunnea f. sp. 'multigermtubi' TaxID=698441 RepID=UPI002395AE75|nr:hypothetical protein L3040_005270 [Drepanopeziza brunnea f. sp. 'multigermtubi']